jgi:hypothetical protein
MDQTDQITRQTGLVSDMGPSGFLHATIVVPQQLFRNLPDPLSAFPCFLATLWRLG